MKSRGFTLIEILIVIIIISIIASVATLTIHFNRNKQAEALAKNLVNLITLAEEEAMLRSSVLGLAFTRDSFQFLIYQENKKTWQPLSEKTFHPKKLADDDQLILIMNGESIPADGKPHIIISPNGDIPAFTISVGQKDQPPLYKVIGEENGRVYEK